MHLAPYCNLNHYLCTSFNLKLICHYYCNPYNFMSFYPIRIMLVVHCHEVCTNSVRCPEVGGCLSLGGISPSIQPRSQTSYI